MKFCKNSAPRLSEGRLIVPSEYADDKALADIARSQRRAQSQGVGGARGHCDQPRGAGLPWHARYFRGVRERREAERQAEGIAKAKRAGIHKGGVRRIDRARVRGAQRDGFSPQRYRQQASHRQVYRILEERKVSIDPCRLHPKRL